MKERVPNRPDGSGWMARLLDSPLRIAGGGVAFMLVGGLPAAGIGVLAGGGPAPGVPPRPAAPSAEAASGLRGDSPPRGEPPAPESTVPPRAVGDVGAGAGAIPPPAPPPLPPAVATLVAAPQ